MAQSNQIDQSLSLTTWQKGGLLVLSFFVVAFGQPVWNDWLGLLAAFAGFACFWRVLLAMPLAKERFCIAMGWFTAVQIVQLSWFVSHPYLYIYGVLFFCAWLMGAQWGILALGIKCKTFQQLPRLFALAGLWTLLEWSRLFLLSGLPFNPVGLSLSGNLYSLQFASIAGVYGLSFWAILTNLLFLRAWIQPSSWSTWPVVFLVALLPYGFGLGHLYYHKQFLSQKTETLSVVLIQSALPIEENMIFQSAEETRQFVLNEWRVVLSTLQKQVGRSIKLIVLPEYLVPYGTFHFVYPFEDIQQMFQELFGDVSKAFPLQENSYMQLFGQGQSAQWLVSNAFLAQTLANFFQAHVVIGLEDSVYVDEQAHLAETYSAAFHFIPGSEKLPLRYEKRILVPMGEYIPFKWCAQLAARYGIRGSFTCGKEAKVFSDPIPFGTSICYEEIYGHLMRQNRLRGAELLVNLTNDGWYPHSRLPKQHFDHARLRTVENGIPLVRACNTGVTGAIDSLGRIVGVIGDHHMEVQDRSDSIFLDVPLYHYQTLYTKYGDFSIIGFSCFCLFLGFINGRKKN
jgi:apolipoprotein N-acyltransferase